MRRFESEYRISERDDVLAKENAIHQDVDLRLDAVEQDAEAFRTGNRADIEAILKGLEHTFGTLAAEMRKLLDQTQGGLSAEIISEGADRVFLTAARRAAILADLRGGVTEDGDTLAKLRHLIETIDVSGPINQAKADLIGGAPQGRRTLKAVSDAATSAQSSADAAKATAGAALSTANAAVTKAGDTMTGDLTLVGDGDRNLFLTRNKVGTSRLVVGGDATLFIHNMAGDKYFGFTTGGDISIPLFGSLNSRIEARGQAWAEWGRNQAATSGRWLHAGDISCNERPGSGGFISPFGAHTMSCDYWTWRFQTADGQTWSAPGFLRYRQFQLYFANQGWVTCGAAS